MSRPLIIGTLAVGMLLSTALLVACGERGDESAGVQEREPQQETEEPERPEGITQEETEGEEAAMAASEFALRSSAFSEGGTIPKVHTCDDRDVSPPLTWQGAPAGTESFALLCDDPDAPRGTWVHWVLYNIPPTTAELAPGLPAHESVLEGSRHGMNDFRRLGYGGPCPPRGPAHRYFFRLLALDRKLDLPPGPTMKQVLEAAEGHILGRAELMGRYGRP